MIKVLVSDFWHVLLFPKDAHTRGSSDHVMKLFESDKVARFFDKFSVNEELLEFYAQLKNESQIQLVIFSSGSLVKTPEVQLLLKPFFDHIYSTVDIRFEKSNPESFRFVAEKLQVKPDEMLFIDDVERNIEAAQEAGLSTIQYTNDEQAILDIQKVFTS